MRRHVRQGFRAGRSYFLTVLTCRQPLETLRERPLKHDACKGTLDTVHSRLFIINYLAANSYPTSQHSLYTYSDIHTHIHTLHTHTHTQIDGNMYTNRYMYIYTYIHITIIDSSGHS